MIVFFRYFILFTLIVFSFSGCERHIDKDMRLAISPWIGYTPLYYAEEKGMLKDAGIKLIHSTSLHETIHYYQADLIDAFLSTQYEASVLSSNSLRHIMAIDRSNGADVVLSNFPLDDINKDKKITAYFEIDSVNNILFDKFIKKHSFNIDNIKIRNKSQVMIKDMKSDIDENVLIVSYEPYSSLLKQRGFMEVGSTYESDLLVLDSLYANKHFVNEHKEKLRNLKSIIKQSFMELNKNPKEFYKVVKIYMENISYGEFVKSLSGIKWLLDEPDNNLSVIFKKHNILLLESEI